MSLQTMELVWKHSRSVGTPRVVLLAIADHDGDNGAWPSVATLARHANVDARNVQRAISRLVELGELRVHTNGGGTHRTPGDRRPNLYEITIRPVDNSSRDAFHGVTNPSPRTNNGVAPLVERGDESGSHGVARTPPEPSLNRKEPPARGGRSGRGIDPSLWTPGVAALHRRWQAVPDLAGLSKPFTLTGDQVDEVQHLLDVHGLDRLMAVAVAVCDGTQRSVRAFIHHWRALPAPGTARDAEPICDICRIRRSLHHIPAAEGHDFTTTERNLA